MTRIVVHPALANRSGPTLLVRPWRWWRCRLRPDMDGNLFRQEYDGASFGSPARPASAADITEARILFGQLSDYDITDPPSFYLTTFEPEYDTIRGYSGYERTLMSRSMTAECDVVWYERPGERWMELPGNTCHPGQYEIRATNRRDDTGGASTRNRFESNMPELRWPRTPSSTGGRAGARMRARLQRAGRELDLEDVGPVAVPRTRGRDLDFAGTWREEVSPDEFARAREINRDEVARAFGVPSALIAPSPVEPRLEDQLEQILAARGEYVMRNQRNPEIVLMNQQDYEQLRREALRSDNLDTLGLFQRADPARPFDAIFGLEVRAVRNLPRGRVYLVRWEDFARWEEPPPLQFPREQLPPPGPARAAVYIAINEAYQRMREQAGYSMAAVESLRGAFQRATPREWIPREWMSPDDIRRLEGLPALPQTSPNVLPEQDVVDEIDRLVNEQVKGGPVDDYRIDRYPRCKHCRHSWHGILCDQCACLGELEED